MLSTRRPPFARLSATLLAALLGCTAAPAAESEQPSASAAGQAGQAGAAQVLTGGMSTGGAAGSAGLVAGSAGTDAPSAPSAGSGGEMASAGSAGVAGQAGQAGAATTGPVDQEALPAVTLFLAGDSTVSEYGEASAQQGWGEHLDEFFIPKVKIDNQALGGRSVRSFMYVTGAGGELAPRWASIQSRLQAGDYVMIEFGINDSSVGSDRFVELAEFKRLLGIMVTDILAAQGVPILVTPTALQEWSGGKEGNKRLGPYAAAMQEVATSEGVELADLNARSVAYLNEIGQAAAANLYFMGDKAHFTLQGGIQMAELLSQEVQAIGSPLGGYVKQ